MRQKLFTILSLAVVLLSSCRENGPAIDISTAQSHDTTYVAAPESPQLRRVLIEEATGVRCSACPAGTKILKQADSAHPNRVIIVGLHAGSQTYMLSISKYDLATDILLPLYSYFGAEPNKPASVFDRTEENGTYFIDARNKWSNIINQRLQVPTPVNMTVTSSYNEAERLATIRVRLAYTAPVTTGQSIGILLKESNIIDPQSDGLKVDTFYRHNHVFRDFVTPLNGTSFLDTLAVKEAGRVFEKTFLYKIPEVAFGDVKKKWNLDNCNVVAFVFNNEAGDKEVAQSAEVKLK